MAYVYNRINLTCGEVTVLYFAPPGTPAVLKGGVVVGNPIMIGGDVVTPTSDPVAQWRKHHIICLTLPPGPTPEARHAAAVAAATARVPALEAAVRASGTAQQECGQRL